MIISKMNKQIKKEIKKELDKDFAIPKKEVEHG
jgi:hypothetical protein